MGTSLTASYPHTDFIRTYTWDKRLESWVKDTAFLGGELVRVHLFRVLVLTFVQ